MIISGLHGSSKEREHTERRAVTGDIERLLHGFEYAGQFAWWELVCLLGVHALLLERCAALSRTAGPQRSLTDALRSHLQQGDLEGALSLAARSRGASARIALEVLKQALFDPARVEAARAAALLREEPTLRTRTGLFGTIASIATLIGLLGSVTGLQVGFGGPTDATSRAVMLAHAISETMGSAAIGLYVASFALVALLSVHGLLVQRVATIRLEARSIVNHVILYRPRLRLFGARPSIESTGYRRSA